MIVEISSNFIGRFSGANDWEGFAIPGFKFIQSACERTLVSRNDAANVSTIPICKQRLLSGSSNLDEYLSSRSKMMNILYKYENNPGYIYK